MLLEGSRFEIAYYSGTGCTAMVARCFCDALIRAGGLGEAYNLSQRTGCSGLHDLLVLAFPVHAFNAPEGVYQWIKTLKPVDNIPAVVISVSGGGKMMPNTASQVSSIKRLKKKGYDIIYDDMLVMPSNFAIATKELLALKLLEVLPDKVAEIVKTIASGVHSQTTPVWLDRFFSKLGELEKPGAHSFGKYVEITEACNGCGWCARNCSSGNISMDMKKPKYAKKCHMCLNCIYGCPMKALMLRKYKFMIIKEGFSIKQLEKKLPLTEPVDIEELTKGILWIGVKRYLQK